MAVEVPEWIQTDPFYRGWVDLFDLFGASEGEAQSTAVFIAVGAFSGPAGPVVGAAKAIKWLGWAITRGNRLGRFIFTPEGLIGVGPGRFLPEGAAGVEISASAWSKALSDSRAIGAILFTTVWYILGGAEPINKTEARAEANLLDQRIGFQVSALGNIQVYIGDGVNIDP
jgi:hypothetical protein